MKSLIIAVVLILNSTVQLWAFPLDLQNDLQSYWSYSPVVTRNQDNSKVLMKLFKRSLWINQTEVPIVETTFTFLSNPKEKTDLIKLANSIKQSLDKKTLKVSHSKNQFKVEGPIPKLNRQLKVDVRLIGNNFLIVTSFIRLGFLKNVNPEVEKLHKTLLTYKGEELTEKTSWIKWFQNLIIKNANADSSNPTAADLLKLTSSISPSTGGLNINLTATDLQKSIVDLNTTAGSSNQNWGNTNNQIGNASNQLGNSNANWANTNNQLGVANKNMGDFNKQVGGMNTNWAESNKIMAQMMDPDHMAKVAFYTAAGAALGAVTINLAVQGVSAGIGYLYELFTGTNKKKIEWEDLEKAMSIWDTQLNDLVKLEQAVDSYLAAFDFFEGKNLTNDYVKQLADVTRDMRFDRDLYLEKFKDQNLTTGCRRMFYNAADELDQKLKEYDQILQFSVKNKVSSGPNYFCNQLNELQRQILTAENQMQDLRLKILLAENQFYDKEGKSLEKRDGQIDEINNKLNKTLIEKKKYDDSMVDRLAATHQTNKEEWISNCLDGKNEQGIKINKENSGIFGGFFTHFKRKELCGVEFEKISKDTISRDAQSVANLSSEENLRRDLKLKSNNFVDLKLSEAQMSWMTRLHVDAYCFQFAHEKLDQIPDKCKDFPELLYSMNLSKGYDKAHNAYEAKCQNRYLKGIQKLASTNEGTAK